MSPILIKITVRNHPKRYSIQNFKQAKSIQIYFYDKYQSGGNEARQAQFCQIPL